MNFTLSDSATKRESPIGVHRTARQIITSALLLSTLVGARKTREMILLKEVAHRVARITVSGSRRFKIYPRVS